MNFTLGELWNYFTDLDKVFDYIIENVVAALGIIVSSPLYAVPVALFCILSLAFAIVALIQFAGGSVYGRQYANPNMLKPNRVYPNPNKVYSSNMPVWSFFFHRKIYKHHKAVEAQKRENERNLKAYEKLVDEQEALKSKRILKAKNQLLVDEYFFNNPNAIKITKDGETFWNEGWQSKKYGRNAASYSSRRFTKSNNYPSDKNIDISADDDN